MVPSGCGGPPQTHNFSGSARVLYLGVAPFTDWIGLGVRPWSHVRLSVLPLCVHDLGRHQHVFTGGHSTELGLGLAWVLKYVLTLQSLDSRENVVHSLTILLI